MTALLEALSSLAGGGTLTRDEARDAFGIVLSGDAPDVQVAALLAILASRGETGSEIAGAAEAMRERMIPAEVPEELATTAIDVCGTGGSGLHTLNVSTATAIVLAGLGVPVAKHGSRAATSQSGSSDVLGALGVGMSRPDEAGRVLEEAGIVFLFAPYHHPGVGRLAGIRSALGFRTAFNVLGPLSNPARVRRQLLGVASQAHLPIMAKSLALSDQCDHAWVVRGEDGLDELTVCGGTDVCEVVGRDVRQARVTPEDAGLDRHPQGALAGGTPQENAAAMRRLLNGERGAYRDAVLLNTAAGLIVAGRVDDLAAGAALAAEAIDRGKASDALFRLVNATTAPRGTP